MQQQVRYVFHRCIVLLLTMIILCGCSGGASKPERKKMPELNSLNGEWNDLYGGQYETNFGFPVRTAYVDLLKDGKATTYLTINLPNSHFDSLAMALAADYTPLALPLLSQWAKQQPGAGILLDIRNTGTRESSRCDYLVQGAGFSIPVIVLYDPASAGRANAFISLLQSVPAVHCKLTGSSRMGREGERQDCFGDY